MLKLSTPNIPPQALDAVSRVIASGQLVHGEEGVAFERALADYLGCADLVLVSSGTAALHVALLALGIGAGDAVLVPDFTFPATASSVALTGARPVAVDVEAGSYVVTAAALEQAIANWQGPEKLRAIMPVHEFGYPADMQAIMAVADAHGMLVIEDAACALGAQLGGRFAGTFGQAGCFSFHPRKTLTTGEGGAIATQDTALAARMRLWRNHGMERLPTGMVFQQPGLNYRLTNFQSALGHAQLPLLDGWIARRRQLAAHYLGLLAPLAARGWLTLPQPHEGHSWQTFMTVLAPLFTRSAVIDAMRSAGIETSLGAQSVSTLGIYTPAPADCPTGRTLYQQGLALPFCEQLDEAQLGTVATTLTHVLEGLAG